MSIFSNNIETSIKVKDLYGFLNVTFLSKSANCSMDDIDTLNAVVRHAFSVHKITNYINTHNIGADGNRILDRGSIESFSEKFKTRVPLLDRIFMGLVLVLMLSDGFEDKYLQDIYNSLLSDTKYYEKSGVAIKIIKGDSPSVKFWIRNSKVKVRFSIDLESRNSQDHFN